MKALSSLVFFIVLFLNSFQVVGQQWETIGGGPIPIPAAEFQNVVMAYDKTSDALAMSVTFKSSDGVSGVARPVFDGDHQRETAF